jgi:S1-C subfamily serine protease
MIRMLQFLLALALIGAPAIRVDASDSGQDQDHLTVAHEELREAVQKIRALHAADGQFTLARDLMNDLRRPRIGILLQSGPGGDGSGGEPGAVVQAVTPGGPAEEAGLRAGDVITRINGEPLVAGSENGPEAWSAASEELVRRSRELADGEVIILEYIRDDAKFDATVVVREMDAGPFFLREIYRPHAPLEAGRLSKLPSITGGTWSIPFGWLDMELVAINSGLGKYFGTEVGVLVVRGPESGDLGLESGDVILTIGDREVKSPEHAMRILRSYEPEEEISLDIIRHGHAQTLSGILPKSRFGLIGESGVFSLEN